MNRFGDGLVTLLMFAMGIGCLNVAFQGLIVGSLDGAKGATFAFASKPAKFVLIEMFWIGFGLILLLAAWRGFFREKVDVDDEQGDDDDEMSHVRPARTPAKALSVKPFAATEPSLNSASSSSVVSVTPFAIATDLKAAQAAAIPRTAAPMPLELYPSRFYAVFVIILFTAFVISSCYTAIALTSIFGNALVAMMFVPWGLFYIKTMAECLHNFFWTGPVLVLDRFGITNYRKGGHLIPWTAVDAVRLDADSATYLILRFRHASDVHTHFGKARWLRSITGHFFYKGFEGKVKLTSLVFTRSEVLQTAKSFLRYSRR